MRGMRMKHGILPALILLFLPSCASNDVEIAKTARTSLLGMSELNLEACLGVPDQKVTSGKTTIFTYSANSTHSLNFTVPIVNAVGISFNGYCHAIFRLEKGRVTEIHYSGDTDDPLGAGKDAVCASIVRSCLEGRATAAR